MKFYFHFHKEVFQFLQQLRYNGYNYTCNIKVQFDFALEVWFSLILR